MPRIHARWTGGKISSRRTRKGGRRSPTIRSIPFPLQSLSVWLWNWIGTIREFLRTIWFLILIGEWLRDGWKGGKELYLLINTENDPFCCWSTREEEDHNHLYSTRLRSRFIKKTLWEIRECVLWTIRRRFLIIGWCLFIYEACLTSARVLLNGKWFSTNFIEDDC